MEGMLRPDTKEQTIGGVEVRNTFKVPKVGLIAGCYVTDGCVKKNAFVNLVRDGIVKFTGKISSEGIPAGGGSAASAHGSCRG